MFQMFASFGIDKGPFSRDLRAMKSEAQAFTDDLERGVSRSSGTFGKLGTGIKGAFSSGKSASDSFWSSVERGASKVTGIFGGLKSAASSIFQGIGQGIGGGIFSVLSTGASGVKDAMFGLNNEMEAATAKINAFTKDGKATADILSMVTDRAAKTPFAFAEMANAAGSLIPVGKQAKISLESLMQTAEILAASNPMEGLEGASFSLREAMTGDFTSIIERFNLSRQSINKWKEQGVSNFEIVQRAMKEMGYDADLVAAMGDTMSGRWSTFRDTVDSFLRTLTKPGFNILKGWLQSTQTLLDANMPRITKFADLIGNKIANGAQFAGGRLLDFGRGVASAFTAVTGAFSALQRGEINIGQFVGGVERMVSTVGGKLDDLVKLAGPKVGAFVGGVVAEGQRLAPQIAAQAGVWGDRFTGWITETAIPFIAPKMGAFFSALGTWVSGTGLPWVSRSVVGLATALTGWIGDTAIPYLQANLPKWGNALVGWITGTYIPTLKSFYGPMAGALGGWITETAVPFLQTNLPKWASAIGTWITTTGAPAVASAAKSLGSALGDWVATDAVPWVQANLPGYATAIGSWIRDTGVPWLVSEAKQLGTALGDWLATDAIPAINANFPIFLTAVGTWLVSGLNDINDFATQAGEKLGKWAETAGPKWLHDWGELWTVLNDQDNFLTKTSSWSQNVGTAVGKWMETAGPKWLHDWDELWKVLNDEDNFLTSTNTWAQNVGKTVGIWMDTAGPAWLHDWGILQTDAYTAQLQISDKVTAWAKDIGGKVGTWIDTAGPAWLHDWGELQTQASNKQNEISEAIVAWAKKVGGAFNTLGPAWLHDWNAAGSAITGALSSAANAGIATLNAFGSKVSQVVGAIGKLLKIEVGGGWQDVPGVGVPNPGGGNGGAGVGELAQGTSNWRGGWAWVGDGNGGSGAELAYLPQGAAIIPHEQSMALAQTGAVPLFGQQKAMPQFADGLNIPGLSNMLDFFKNTPEKIVNMAMTAVGVTAPALPGALAAGGPAILGEVTGWLIAKVKEWVAKAIPIGKEGVDRMVAAAESQLGLPYLWGGGHGIGGPGVGFDCSGFVAWVLDQGGISNPHGIVTAFYDWMSKGTNGIVDIGVNNPYDDPTVQHIGIRLNGTQYESGGPFGGVGKNGTNFAEWGSPPGWEKAKGGRDLGQLAADSFANIMAGKVEGQWSAGNVPPLSALADVDPRLWTKEGITRLQKSMPTGRAFANGGVVDEPVRGMGIDSGVNYLIGEAGRELIIPEKVMPLIASYFQAAFLAGKADVPELRKVPITLRGAVKAIMEKFLRNNATKPKGRGQAAQPQMGLNLPSTPVVTGGDATLGDPNQPKPLPLGEFATLVARTLSNPGKPLRDIGQAVDLGDARTGAASGGSGGGVGAGDWKAAVREGINESFLFTVFGGGKPSGTTGGGNTVTDKGGVIVRGESAPWVYVPLGAPAGMPFDDPGYKPLGAPAGMPTGDEWGEFKPGGPTKNNLGMPSITLPKFGGDQWDTTPGSSGMIGHFPEPVRPHPGHGGWFIGVHTNAIYDGDGNVIEDGTAATLGNPNQPRPQPSGTFDAAGAIRRGLSTPSVVVDTPASAAGGTGGTSAGTAGGAGAMRIEIVNSGRVDLVLPDGSVIAARIRQSAPAMVTLAEGVTDLQAEWESDGDR